jgi:hypothetical protein
LPESRISPNPRLSHPQAKSKPGTFIEEDSLFLYKLRYHYNATWKPHVENLYILILFGLSQHIQCLQHNPGD